MRFARFSYMLTLPLWMSACGDDLSGGPAGNSIPMLGGQGATAGMDTTTTGTMTTTTPTTTTTGSDSTGGDACRPDEVRCDGTCIDPLEDEDYCGAWDTCLGSQAGERCDDEQTCVDGRCESDCRSGEIVCDGECIDPDRNVDFCGASGDCEGHNEGEKCRNGDVCVDGRCEDDCPSGELVCDGACIDPETDEDYCGASDDCEGSDQGRECDDDEVCIDGRCEDESDECRREEVLCDGECIDPETDEDYCGARDDCRGSNAGEECDRDETCEEGRCTDEPGTGDGWGREEQIDEEREDVSEVQTVMDDDGNVTAVYIQDEHVYAVRYDERDERWDSPRELDNDDGRDITDLQVGSNRDGDIFVAWIEDEHVFAQFYDAGRDEWDDWAHEVQNENESESLTLSVDPQSNRAMLAWVSNWGSSQGVEASYFNGTSWQWVQTLQEFGSQDVGAPCVSLNEDGNAVVAYTRRSNNRERIFARRWEPSGTSGWWQQGAYIDTSESSDQLSPQVFMADNGDALAMWVSDGSRPTIRYARLEDMEATDWDNPDEIDDSDDVDPRAGIRFADNGQDGGVAVWLSDDRVYAAVLERGEFERAEMVQTDDEEDAHDPAVAVASDGQVMVVWAQEDSGETSIYANLGDVNDSDGDWKSRPTRVESGDDDASMPAVAINRQGRAAAVWLYDGSDQEAWANLYDYDRRASYPR